MSRTLRCMDCGKKLDNEVYFKCDDCLKQVKLKKNCTHSPETLDYITNCRKCGKQLKAVKWEES